MGRFINGDPWVAVDPGTGMVGIVSISPGDIPGRSGYQINLTTRQSFDRRLPGFSPAIQPSLPFSVGPDNSIIKALSSSDDASCRHNRSQRCYLEAFAILTVLDSPPAAEGSLFFRPPFVTEQGMKPLISVEDLRLDLLPSLENVPPRAPTMASLISQLSTPQWEPLGVVWSEGYPQSAGPSDHGLKAKRNVDAILRLFFNESYAAKAPLLIHLIQYGIDLFAQTLIESPSSPPTPHPEGRKLLLAFTALLIDNDFGNDMKNFVLTSPKDAFLEGSASYVSDVNSEVLAGSQGTEYAYWKSIASPGSSTLIRDPYQIIDGGSAPGGEVQTRFMEPLVGTSLIVRSVPGLLNLWNHSPSLDIGDRWISSGAHTQPDVCAPAAGRCRGGPHDGRPCTLASHTSCSKGRCDIEVAWDAHYAKTFGPDGNGYCIVDRDRSDGMGRFPKSHGITTKKSPYRSEFARDLWQRHRFDSVASSPHQDKLRFNRDCVDPRGWWQDVFHGVRPNGRPCIGRRNTIDWIRERPKDDFQPE